MNERERIAKLYRAGAEYVLTLATVSGRMLGSDLLDEAVISLNTQIELVRTEASELVGRSLAKASGRSHTNCTVLAVERKGDLLTEIRSGFMVEASDSLIVAGSDADADINRFTKLLSGG